MRRISGASSWKWDAHKSWRKNRQGASPAPPRPPGRPAHAACPAPLGASGGGRHLRLRIPVPRANSVSSTSAAARSRTEPSGGPPPRAGRTDSRRAGPGRARSHERRVRLDSATGVVPTSAGMPVPDDPFAELGVDDGRACGSPAQRRATPRCSRGRSSSVRRLPSSGCCCPRRRGSRHRRRRGAPPAACVEFTPRFLRSSYSLRMSSCEEQAACGALRHDLRSCFAVSSSNTGGPGTVISTSRVRLPTGPTVSQRKPPSSGR